jgi:hypothetical protein
MHGKVAAGKFTKMNFNDELKQVEVVAKVIDPVEWQKCQEGVYTGFSVGGSYGDVWQEGGVKKYVAKPVEGSLVDNPCMPGAQFTALKMDGSQELRKFVTTEGEEAEPDTTGGTTEVEKAAESEDLEKDVVIIQGAATDPEQEAREAAVQQEIIYSLDDVWFAINSLSMQVARIADAVCPAPPADDTAMEYAAKDELNKSAEAEDSAVDGGGESDGDEADAAASDAPAEESEETPAEEDAAEPDEEAEKAAPAGDLQKIGDAGGDLAKVVEVQRQELAKAVGEISLLKGEVEKLRSEPAPGGPILNAAALQAQVVEKAIGGEQPGAGGQSEAEVLQKMIAGTNNPVVQTALREQLTLLQIKQIQNG